MKLVANLLLVLGVCIGALGASGFHAPYGAPEGTVAEDWAVTLFVLGLVLLGAGGVTMRAARAVRADRAGGAHAGKRAYEDEIDAIHARVVELDEAKERLSEEELRDRIGKLLAEEYFDLTSKSDDLIALVGFSDYARVWEGVATAERLLARCWSMCADGHRDEGIVELPLARASLAGAVEAVSRL
jgi:hypothetical protein